jgi:hypothetical protein
MMLETVKSQISVAEAFALPDCPLAKMAELAVDGLKQDQVVLARNIAAASADDLLFDIAERLGLAERLKLQAGFASILGHRKNIGKYFMSVNQRGDFQFVTPHSEGSSYAGMQLAAFFCVDNSTDGGVTILMNTNSEADVWTTLLERKVKPRLTNIVLSKWDKARAKSLYGLDMDDLLEESDKVISEDPSEIAGLTIATTLEPAKKTYSTIMERDLYVYWDTIASFDFQCCDEYVRMLKVLGLNRKPVDKASDSALDLVHKGRIWRSNATFERLFKQRIVRKLSPGELVVFNNFTWTHSATNWTPGSGARQILAAFA